MAGLEPGGPAGRAGLEAGDLIVAMNGRPVESYDRDARIKALRASPLELTVRRGDTVHEVSMSLE